MTPDEFLELVKLRRTIRAFKPEMPPDDDLMAVLEAGCYAPHAHPDEESWRFILIKNKEIMRKFGPSDADFNKYAYSAPAWIAVAWRTAGMPDKAVDIQGFFDPDKPPPSLAEFKEFMSRTMHGLMGVGHAVQNLLLAATIRGLGVGYVGTFDPPPPPEFERAFSIEKPFCLLMILPIGYPAEDHPSESKDMSKIVKVIE